MAIFPIALPACSSVDRTRVAAGSRDASVRSDPEPLASPTSRLVKNPCHGFHAGVEMSTRRPHAGQATAIAGAVGGRVAPQPAHRGAFVSVTGWFQSSACYPRCRLAPCGIRRARRRRRKSPRRSVAARPAMTRIFAPAFRPCIGILGAKLSDRPSFVDRARPRSRRAQER